MAADGIQDNVVARRLDHLFRTVTDSDGRPIKPPAVAAALRERGIDLTSQYVQQLRDGKRGNPTVNVLRALAEFFGVPTTYLVAEDHEVERINQQLKLLTHLRRHKVAHVAMRAAPLSGKNLEHVLQAIELARAAEGLPPSDIADDDHM